MRYDSKYVVHANRQCCPCVDCSSEGAIKEIVQVRTMEVLGQIPAFERLTTIFELFDLATARVAESRLPPFSS